MYANAASSITHAIIILTVWGFVCLSVSVWFVGALLLCGFVRVGAADVCVHGVQLSSEVQRRLQSLALPQSSTSNCNTESFCFRVRTCVGDTGPCGGLGAL